jgi:hypothetical protein
MQVVVTAVVRLSGTFFRFCTFLISRQSPDIMLLHRLGVICNWYLLGINIFLQSKKLKTTECERIKYVNQLRSRFGMSTLLLWTKTLFTHRHSYCSHAGGTWIL